jgi:hypothetical protein
MAILHHVEAHPLCVPTWGHMLPDRLVQCPVTQGIVTNATDVKPLLTVATYLDTTTGIEVYQEITGPC